MCVVKLEGVPQLCKTDEIGEMCVCTVATGTSYYGLAGMTKNTFEVRAWMLRLFIYLVCVLFTCRVFKTSAGLSRVQQRHSHQRVSLHQDRPAGIHRTCRSDLCCWEDGRSDGGRWASAQCWRHCCYGAGCGAHEVRIQRTVSVNIALISKQGSGCFSLLWSLCLIYKREMWFKHTLTQPNRAAPQ